MPNKARLQPLRISSGWLVEINSFYEIDPSEDALEWLHGNPLISCTNTHTGFSVEVLFEPEGDSKGEYIIQFYKFEIKKKSIDYKSGSLISSKTTKKRSEVVELIEEFMLS